MSGRPDNQIHVRKGRLTLPQSVRKAAKVPDDATMVARTVGSAVILAPNDKVASFLENALEFRREVDEAGVTLDDLLTGLKEERVRYTREVYGL